MQAIALPIDRRSEVNDSSGHPRKDGSGHRPRPRQAVVIDLDTNILADI
jgi:hypothetical protein